MSSSTHHLFLNSSMDGECLWSEESWKWFQRESAAQPRAFLTSLSLSVWGCLSSTQECPILPSALRSPWPLSPASLTLESEAPASSTGSAQAQSHEGPSMTLGRSRGSAPSAWGLTPRQTHPEMAGSAGKDPTVPSLPAHPWTCACSQVKVEVGKDQLLLHQHQSQSMVGFLKAVSS